MFPIFLTALLACSSGDDSLEQRVRAHLEDDPDQAAALVDGVEDPVERVQLVEAVTTNRSQAIRAFCDALEPSPARNRCQKRMDRPHLVAEGDAGTRPGAADLPSPYSAGKGQSFGPVTGRPSEPAPYPQSPFSALAPVDTPCAKTPAPTSCVETLAAQAIRASDAERAYRICISMERDDLAWECLFQSAERAVRLHGSEAYGPAVDLCLASGTYTRRCLHHLGAWLAVAAPGATEGGADAWQPVLDAADAIEKRWGGQPRQLPILDRYWSDVAAFTYDETDELVGNPLDRLPEEAHPHLRAAAAFRALQLQPPSHRDLAGWSEHLGRSLSRRVTPGPVTPPGDELPFRKIPDLWQRTLPEEASLTRIHYLGTAYRAVVDEPVIDRTLCVLEAAARYEPRPLRLLLDAADHVDERVRWTAVRLLGNLDPHGPWTGRFADDPSALVTQRLAATREETGPPPISGPRNGVR